MCIFQLLRQSYSRSTKYHGTVRVAVWVAVVVVAAAVVEGEAMVVTSTLGRVVALPDSVDAVSVGNTS